MDNSPTKGKAARIELLQVVEHCFASKLQLLGFECWQWVKIGDITVWKPILSIHCHKQVKGYCRTLFRPRLHYCWCVGPLSTKR